MLGFAVIYDYMFVIGDVVEFSVKIEPEAANAQISWSSSDRSVLTVVTIAQTNDRRVKVTGVGAGNATLTVHVDEYIAVCEFSCTNAD